MKACCLTALLEPVEEVHAQHVGVQPLVRHVQGVPHSLHPEIKADIMMRYNIYESLRNGTIGRTPNICLTALSAKRSFRKASASLLALKRSWNLNWKNDKPASRFLCARHIMDGDG
jgi:hypothetical protein